jgi:hypothetical protein
MTRSQWRVGHGEVGVGVLALVALLLIGCSSGTASLPQRHADQLMSKACRDINSTMAPAPRPSPFVAWDESDPGQSLFQPVVVAVGRAPNARLHSEIGVIESAVSGHPADSGSFDNAAGTLVKTCKQLGFAASAR